jgi:hypothetical protein
MSNDNRDKIGEVAADLDDLRRSVDELKYDPPANVHQPTIDALKQALEDATEAVDELENKKE